MSKAMQNVKVFLSIGMVAVLMFTTVPLTQKVQAAASLPLNEWHTSFIAETISEETFSVTIPSSGRITFNIRSFLNVIDYDIIDTDGYAVIKEFYSMGGSDSAPKISQESLYLVAGTYYIRARKFGSYTGKYEIQAMFTSANVTEVESNETPETANTITSSEWNTGIISETDTLDYFKISIPSSGKILFNFRSFLNIIDYPELFRKIHSIAAKSA